MQITIVSFRCVLNYKNLYLFNFCLNYILLCRENTTIKYFQKNKEEKKEQEIRHKL